MNNNKKLILTLYKSKLLLCKNIGYKLGNWKVDVKPNFNISKILIKDNKYKATVIANQIRQGYKDRKYINDEKLINIYIDNGFYILRKLNNYLNNNKTKKK